MTRFNLDRKMNDLLLNLSSRDAEFFDETIIQTFGGVTQNL